MKKTMILILNLEKIEIRGLKYDASNLTKELGKNSDTIFLKNLNKEIQSI